MASSAQLRQSVLRESKRARANPPASSPQLGKILDHATEVFCHKGYQGASMRDIARATGMSLAGMYHYLGSKERLLHPSLKTTFYHILSHLREPIRPISP